MVLRNDATDQWKATTSFYIHISNSKYEFVLQNNRVFYRISLKNFSLVGALQFQFQYRADLKLEY